MERESNFKKRWSALDVCAQNGEVEFLGQSEPKLSLGGGFKNQSCSECPETHFGLEFLKSNIFEIENFL